MWVGDGFSDRFDSNLVGGTKEKRKFLFRLEKCRETVSGDAKVNFIAE